MNTKPPDTPTLRDLTAAKTKVGAWVPPIVRQRLDTLTERDGIPMSQRIAELVTGHVFPELPVPLSTTLVTKDASNPFPPEPHDDDVFETIGEFKTAMVERGIIAEEHADEAVEMMRSYFMLKGGAQ